VLNNINIPDDIALDKLKSEVELSFQVDKNGTPVNIKVTKTSDCKLCDDAAVRVVKEGPKWSRKGKNTKTIVSIAVDK
jgi:TonB family protein